MYLFCGNSYFDFVLSFDINKDEIQLHIECFSKIVEMYKASLYLEKYITLSSAAFNLSVIVL